jgi:hypothetical protein
MVGDAELVVGVLRDAVVEEDLGIVVILEAIVSVVEDIIVSVVFLLLLDGGVVLRAIVVFVLNVPFECEIVDDELAVVVLPEAGMVVCDELVIAVLRDKVGEEDDLGIVIVLEAIDSADDDGVAVDAVSVLAVVVLVGIVIFMLDVSRFVEVEIVVETDVGILADVVAVKEDEPRIVIVLEVKDCA